MRLRTQQGLTAFLAPCVLVLMGLAESSQQPQFDGDNALLRPTGYREWVFVGSSLGLRYAQNPNEDRSGPRGPASQVYHNVYINPSSYREFSRTGKFPDGTMMVLELANSEGKKEPGLQGSYQKDYVGLEASVKDSRRFDGNWAYFSFDNPDGTLKDKAKALPQDACWSCHHTKAATDHVFTQFYPVLRALRSPR
ncbi:MAG: cytochrome P460 family protein [Acidobacteriota bacterium]